MWHRDWAFKWPLKSSVAFRALSWLSVGACRIQSHTVEAMYSLSALLLAFPPFPARHLHSFRITHFILSFIYLTEVMLLQGQSLLCCFLVLQIENYVDMSIDMCIGRWECQTCQPVESNFREHLHRPLGISGM